MPRRYLSLVDDDLVPALASVERGATLDVSTPHAFRPPTAAADSPLRTFEQLNRLRSPVLQTVHDADYELERPPESLTADRRALVAQRRSAIAAAEISDHRHLTEMFDEIGPEQLELQFLDMETIQQQERWLRTERLKGLREQSALKQQHLMAYERVHVQSQADVAAARRRDAEIEERVFRQHRAELLVRLQTVQRAFRLQETKLDALVKTHQGVLATIDRTRTIKDNKTNQYSRVKDKSWQVEWRRTPHPLRIYVNVMRAIKDKLPKGEYVMHVSIYDQLAGTRHLYPNVTKPSATAPVPHNGNYYNVDLWMHQFVYLTSPAPFDLRTSMVLMFQLYHLASLTRLTDEVVGWGVLPLCNSEFEIVKGKFMVPLLRGPIDPSVTRFERIDHLIRSDLQNWLGNLYFDIDHLSCYHSGQREYTINLQYWSQYLDPPDNTGDDVDDGADDARSSKAKARRTGLQRARKAALAEVEAEEAAEAAAIADAAASGSPAAATAAAAGTPPKAGSSTASGAPAGDAGALGSLATPVRRMGFTMGDLAAARNALKAVNRKSLSPGTAASTTAASTSTASSAAAVATNAPAAAPSVAAARWSVAARSMASAASPSRRVRSVAGRSIASIGSGTHGTLTPAAAPAATGKAGRRQRRPRLASGAAVSQDAMYIAPVLRRPGVTYVVHQDLSLDPGPGKRRSHIAALQRTLAKPAELAEHSFSVRLDDQSTVRRVAEVARKVKYMRHEMMKELHPREAKRPAYWFTIIFMLALIYGIQFVRSLGQAIYLNVLRVPIRSDYVTWAGRIFEYRSDLLSVGVEIGMVLVGTFTVIIVFAFLIMLSFTSQRVLGFFPNSGSRFVATLGFISVLDPLLRLAFDLFIWNTTYGDGFRLYRYFDSTEGNGPIGVFLTLFLYALLVLLSVVMMYIYVLYLHMNGRMLDVYNRLSGEPKNFHVPDDLELSVFELQDVLDRARRWRGEGGASRRVLVLFYTKPQAGQAMPPSAFQQPPKDGSTITHIVLLNIGLNDFAELHRHFVRFPDGTLVEVFGNVETMSETQRTTLLDHLTPYGLSVTQFLFIWRSPMFQKKVQSVVLDDDEETGAGNLGRNSRLSLAGATKVTSADLDQAAALVAMRDAPAARLAPPVPSGKATGASSGYDSDRRGLLA